MTTFFATLRITHAYDKGEPLSLAVEIPASDLPAAVHMLMAFKAGLAVHPRFVAGSEESLSAAKTRGQYYLTLREAANHLRDRVFVE